MMIIPGRDGSCRFLSVLVVELRRRIASRSIEVLLTPQQWWPTSTSGCQTEECVFHYDTSWMVLLVVVRGFGPPVRLVDICKIG